MSPAADREQHATDVTNRTLAGLCEALTAEARCRAEEAAWLYTEGRWSEGVALEGEARGLLTAARLVLERLRA